MSNTTCRICGDSPAGLHCGAVTCEACKKFFQRVITKRVEVNGCIEGNDSCVVTKHSRTRCLSCRYNKCVASGMRGNNERVESQRVDFSRVQCKVCGDRASGVHFGVITCEGCKGFFRRISSSTVVNGLRCQANGQCEILPMSRNSCRKCRYDRCISAGMDLNNSKIGRQSNLFKRNLNSSLSINQPQHSQATAVSDYSSITSHQTQITPHTSLYPMDSSRIELELDHEVRDMIQLIKSAYLNCKFQKLYLDMQQRSIENFDRKAALLIFCKTAETSISFVDQILSRPDIIKCLHKLGEPEREAIRMSSVHIVRLVKMTEYSVQNEHQSTSFFECESDMCRGICHKVLPAYEKIGKFFSDMIEWLAQWDLDPNEYALFAALWCFTSSNRVTKYPYQLDKIELEDAQTECAFSICNALRQYMQSRRRKDDSCLESVMNCTFRFEKMNLFLQHGLVDQVNKLKQELNEYLARPEYKVLQRFMNYFKD